LNVEIDARAPANSYARSHNRPGGHPQR
jgi:hypothetical protein